MLNRWFLAVALALTSLSAWAAPGKVLVVLSAVDYVSNQGGGRHPTGFFLTELATPLKALIESGYQITYATPNGRAPVMDKVSDDARWFGSQAAYEEARALVAGQGALKAPRALWTFDENELKSYAGVFLPGGHAPMEDLARDIELGRILRHFHRFHKPTALICHAPIALLSARRGHRWIYSGYRMTVFSTVEEKQEEDAGHLDGKLTYYVQRSLAGAGGRVTVGTPWTSNVVKDRELITGQNPMSDKAFARALVDALTHP